MKPRKHTSLEDTRRLQEITELLKKKPALHSLFSLLREMATILSNDHPSSFQN
jgi:hypothetical protein